MRYFLLFVLTLSWAESAVPDFRRISYFQNDNRREMIHVSIGETAKWTVVAIYDLRKDRVDKALTLPMEEFGELWQALTSSDAAPFIVHRQRSDKAAPPGFYAFTLMEKKSTTEILVPRDSCPKSILAVAIKMKSYVEKIRR